MNNKQNNDFSKSALAAVDIPRAGCCLILQETVRGAGFFSELGCGNTEIPSKMSDKTQIRREGGAEKDPIWRGALPSLDTTFQCAETAGFNECSIAM